MSSKSFANSVVAVGLMVALLAACSDATSPQDDFGIQGTYVLHWTKHAAVCSPVELPAPLSTDVSLYVNPPSFSGVVVDSMYLVRPDSSSTILTPIDSLGKRDSRGPFNSKGGVGAVATRSRGPLTEGPRAGGHTFSVAESDEWRYFVLSLVLLPPGHGVQDEIDIESTSTLTYRDGGPSGSIFTTCVANDTASGGRASSRIL